MSTGSQGPSWWQASDGNWYPPESHPSVRLEPDSASAAAAGASGPPGWWIASDGNWYPPESHPSVATAMAAPETPQTPHRYGPAGGAGGYGAAAPPVKLGLGGLGGGPAGGYNAASDPRANLRAGKAVGSGGFEPDWSPAAATSRGASRRPRRSLVMSGVVAVLIVGGASAWFVTRSNAPPTHSPATPTSARTTGSSGESSTPALGQSSTVAVDGTTLSMTITKTLRPAPLGVSQRVETKGRVGIAAYVTVTNSGRRSYSLTKLVFGLTVGALSVGGVGYDTTAGSALPRTGHLAPGATAAGWVTQLGPASGRIRSVSCAFDVHSGTSAWKTVFRIWTVK